MHHEKMFDILAAELDELQRKAAQVDGAPDIASAVANLKKILMSGTAISEFDPAASQDDDLIQFRPFEQNSNSNFGPDPEAHEFEFVKRACQIGMAFAGRTRKAYHHAIAAMFVWWRNANHFALGELVQTTLKEKISDKRELAQVARVCLDLINVPGNDPDIVAQNRANNDAVARAATILRELDSVFKNRPLRLDDLDDIGLVRQCLARKDRKRRKSDVWVVAQILDEPKKNKGTGDDTDEGDVADGDGDGDGVDKDSDSSAGAAGDDGKQEDAHDHPLSKAEWMLGGAPGVDLGTMLAYHSGPGARFLIGFVCDAAGVARSVAAIPCEGNTAKAVYEEVRVGGPIPLMAVLADMAATLAVLNTPSKPNTKSNSKKPTFEPACPATVITIGPDNVVKQITASATETAGTVMVSITPTTETKLDGITGGQFIATEGWDAVPAKAIIEALAANDALVRVTLNDAAGFDAIITIPRLPEFIIRFVPYEPKGDGGVRVPDHSKIKFTTQIVLNSERLGYLREYWAVPFLAGTKDKQRLPTIKVGADAGSISIEHTGKNKIEKSPAEVTQQGGVVAEILAVDFFKVIDSLTLLGSNFDTSIGITADGVVGLRAFSEHSQIEVVIPPVVPGSLVRSDAFTAAPLSDGGGSASTPSEQPKALPAPSEPVKAKRGGPKTIKPAATKVEQTAPKADLPTGKEPTAPDTAKAAPKRGRPTKAA